MSWLRYRWCGEYIAGVFENGKEMLFDALDLEVISSYPWFIDNEGYPSTTYQGKRQRLHRILLEGSVPKDMVVDHINRNKLDNRRENLRIVKQIENVRNCDLRSNNLSGVPGVFFDKRAKRWRCQIYKNHKTVHVGIFDDFEDAVAARKQAYEKLIGGDFECVQNVE